MNKTTKTNSNETIELKIDYVLALTYIFKDPAWIKKTLIGTALILGSFFVIPWFFLMGYYIRTIRHVSSGKRYSLPNWDDWEELGRTGLKLTFTALLYYSPIFLLMVAFYGAVFIFLLICVGIAKFLPNNSPHTLLYGIQLVISILIMIVGSISFFVLEILYVFLMPLISVALAAWLHVVEIRFTVTDSIRRCFDLREMWDFVKKNSADCFLVFLMIIAVNYLSLSVGILLLFVGIFFAAFYSMMVGAHLKGQLISKTLVRNKKDYKEGDKSIG